MCRVLGRDRFPCPLLAPKNSHEKPACHSQHHFSKFNLLSSGAVFNITSSLLGFATFNLSNCGISSIRGYLIFLDSISPLMKQVGMTLLRDTDFAEGKDSRCLYVKFFHFVWGPIKPSHVPGTADPVPSPFSEWAGLEQLSSANNRGERAATRVCVCNLWFQMGCAGNDSDIQERNNSD